MNRLARPAARVPAPSVRNETTRQGKLTGGRRTRPSSTRWTTTRTPSPRSLRCSTAVFPRLEGHLPLQDTPPSHTLKYAFFRSMVPAGRPLKIRGGFSFMRTFNALYGSPLIYFTKNFECPYNVEDYVLCCCVEVVEKAGAVCF